MGLVAGVRLVDASKDAGSAHIGRDMGDQGRSVAPPSAARRLSTILE